MDDAKCNKESRPIIRDKESGRFTTGNASGGRKKLDEGMKYLASLSSENLRKIAGDKQTRPELRASIYMYAHDKVYGKPKQAIDFDGEMHLVAPELSLSERAEALKAALEAIEAPNE